MRLALPVAIAAALCACGTVEDRPNPADAASTPDSSTPDAESTFDAEVADALLIDAIEYDARACTGDTVEQCGPQCRMCVVNNDRQLPTCDGNACGVACRSGVACTDSTCSRLVWDFEDRTTGGLVPRSPGLRMSARNFNGANTLAVDLVFDNTVGEVLFEVPVCNSGTVNLRPRAVKYRVFYDTGSNDTVGQFYTQAFIPNKQTGAFLPGITVFGGRYNEYSQAVSGSQFSETTSIVTIALGTYGAHFTGTVYVDDIRFE
jgi:hypothetical protein